MKIRKVHTTAVVVLAFLSLGAIASGIGLLNEPDGGNLGLPLNLLDDTPFNDFFYPGLMLLVFNGLLPVMIIFLTVLRTPNFPVWIIIQGLLLIIWLAVQIFYGIYDALLTTLYLLIGITLLALGIRLRKEPLPH